jgi:hypothetical protein
MSDGARLPYANATPDMSYMSTGRVPIARVRRLAMMEATTHEEENTMAIQNEGKDMQGRSYDQVTKDGSSSAATMGAGGTGNVGLMSGERAAERDGKPGGGIDTASDPGGNRQAGRTDDLLSDGTQADRGDGYVGEEAGELQTGMGGIGSLSTGNAGSRQSEGEAQPGGANGAMDSGSKEGARLPESGGQHTRN